MVVNLSNVITWLASWFIIFAIIIALLQTSWGKVIVYWSTWLLIVLLLVTHANEIGNIFTSGNITAGQYTEKYTG